MSSTEETNTTAAAGQAERSVRPDPERAEFERWVDIERPSLRAAVRTYDESLALAHVMDAARLAWEAGRAAERERIAAAWDGVECDVHCNGLVDVGASIRAGHLVDRDGPNR